MPLRRRAASGKQNEGVILVRRFRHWPRQIENETGATIGCEKFSVGEQATLLIKTGNRKPETGNRRIGLAFLPISGFRFPVFRQRPLDSSTCIDVRVVLDAGEIARLAAREFL